MARIIAMSRIPVKPFRRTARKPAPFGQGIPLYRTPADETWWAQQTWSNADIPDAEWDRLAEEAMMLARYEAGLEFSDRCILCGKSAPGELVASMCDDCNLRLEMNQDVDRCANCGRQDDFLDPETKLCPPCMLAAEESSFGGNHGF